MKFYWGTEERYEELKALADLFKLKIIKFTKLFEPGILVETADGHEANIWMRHDGDFWAFDKIPGVPGTFFPKHEPSMRFRIDI